MRKKLPTYVYIIIIIASLGAIGGGIALYVLLGHGQGRAEGFLWGAVCGAIVGLAVAMISFSIRGIMRPNVIPPTEPVSTHYTEFITVSSKTVTFVKRFKEIPLEEVVTVDSRDDLLVITTRDGRTHAEKNIDNVEECKQRILDAIQRLSQ